MNEHYLKDIATKMHYHILGTPEVSQHYKEFLALTQQEKIFVNEYGAELYKKDILPKQ